MNWILIAAPVAAIALIPVGLWIGRRIVPIRHVNRDARDEHVTKIGRQLAGHVVDAIQRERGFVVRAAAIKHMEMSGRAVAELTPTQAVGVEMETEMARRQRQGV